MRAIAVLFGLMTIAPSAHAALEGDFVGRPGWPTVCVSQKFPGGPASNDDIYTGFSIHSIAAQTYEIVMNQNSKPFPPQVYICDGIEHQGDGANTGDTYTANCDRVSIRIRRVFHQLKYPLISDFEWMTQGAGLVETFDGDPFRRSCDFINAPK